MSTPDDNPDHEAAAVVAKLYLDRPAVLPIGTDLSSEQNLAAAYLASQAELQEVRREWQALDTETESIRMLERGSELERELLGLQRAASQAECARLTAERDDARDSARATADECAIGEARAALVDTAPNTEKP